MFVGFHLLDRQIVDCDGLLVGKVDDVELSEDDPPRIVALLLGPAVLGQRMGGLLGGAIVGAARWLHPDADPALARIAYEQVAILGTAVHLRIPRRDLPRPSLERWLCDHAIARIPGADRAGE